MALSLLFGILGAPGRSRVAIGQLRPDATISETTEFRSEVTDHPIELGSTISDHVFIQPRRVRIEGDVTNAPLEIFGGVTGIAGSLAGIVGGGVADVVAGAATGLLTGAGLSERRVEAYEQLRELFDTRRVITVVTGMDVFPNMVITSLTAPRDTRTGQKLRFTAELQQLTFVTTEAVSIDVEDLPPPEQDIAASGSNAGQQSTQAIDPTAGVTVDGLLDGVDQPGNPFEREQSTLRGITGPLGAQ